VVNGHLLAEMLGVEEDNIFILIVIDRVDVLPIAHDVGSSRRRIVITHPVNIESSTGFLLVIGITRVEIVRVGRIDGLKGVILEAPVPDNLPGFVALDCRVLTAYGSGRVAHARSYEISLGYCGVHDIKIRVLFELIVPDPSAVVMRRPTGWGAHTKQRGPIPGLGFACAPKGSVFM